MGMILPIYSYNPDPSQYQPKTYANAYAWFTVGHQELERPDRMGAMVACKIYSSKAEHDAGLPPVEILSLGFPLPPGEDGPLNDPDDIARCVYGIYPDEWVRPTALNPFTGQTEPLRGLKAMTAYLLRRHPVFAQPGAQWD